MILKFRYKECCRILNLEGSLPRSSLDFQQFLYCHIGHVEIRGSEQEYSALWTAVQSLTQDPRFSNCQNWPMPQSHEQQHIPRKGGLDDEFVTSTGSPAPLSNNFTAMALSGSQYDNELITAHDMNTPILVQGIQPQTDKEKPIKLVGYTIILQELSVLKGITLSYNDLGQSESGFTVIASYGGLQARGEAGNRKEAKHKASKAVWDKYEKCLGSSSSRVDPTA